MIRVMSATPITLYGIPNCTSVKKAREWMNAHQVPHDFHDFKKQGLSAEHLSLWLSKVDWTVLLNRKGTTWRGLDAATQGLAKDAASAQQLMLQWPSLVKGQKVVIGVNPEAWLGVIEE